MLFLLLLVAYLLGSIPFGYLIAKHYNIDIRKHGSGNVGATNVFRILGPKAGALVFFLDMIKGTAAVYLASQFTDNHWIIIIAGFLAILGHTYSVFLKFKGGRGAATGLGVLLGIAPNIFLMALIIAALIIYATRYVSLASIITSILVALIFLISKQPLPYSLTAIIVAIIIVVRHIPNIKRLLNRTEPKIGVKP